MNTQRAGESDEAERRQDSPRRGDDSPVEFPNGAPARVLGELCLCSVGELFGGVERHLLGVLSALAARGAKPLLILFHDGELASRARAMGVDLMVLPDRIRRSFATSRQLAHILESRGIRIVHVHGYKATVICAMAQRYFRFRMVKTEHGLPEAMHGRPVQVLRDRFYHLLDRVATRMAKANVCYVTAELRDHYRAAHVGLRTSVIENGICNLDRATLRRPPELAQAWFNLSIVGRLDTVKGHAFAIEAIANKEMPQDVHLHVLGTGPCEAGLQQLAENRGIAKRVHFHGFREDIYEFVAHSNAVLIPSLHEGLPYTLLEAMAVGTPIVASRTGGLATVLRHAETALLVAPRDSVGLAEAILRLYRDPSLAARLGQSARQLQQSRYSVDAMMDGYLSIYRELTASDH